MLLLLPQRYKFSSKSQRCPSEVIVFNVVVATAKVQIFKQITTLGQQGRDGLLLLLLPQRYKFSSKSQHDVLPDMFDTVVVATAKVQIFKQITTVSKKHVNAMWLLLLPQRYKFSSKSQHKLLDVTMRAGCCCYRKGTNFQANHNVVRRVMPLFDVVVATAKVQIFKQITTPENTTAEEIALLLLPQRYKFSSKSQQKDWRGSLTICCCCYRKGTNFQANHNRLRYHPSSTYVVVATAKVQIFKQITTRT